MKTILFICSMFTLISHGQVVKERALSTVLTEFTYQYKGAKRVVPLKIYMPKLANGVQAPVILMSHGLGGTREIGAYLGNHWAARGFVVVAMQHAGSDKDVMQGKARRERFRALKKAASIESFMSRVHDVPATLNQITKWNVDASHVLFKKLDLDKIGMCGHSFGAVTTQSVSGQSHPVIGQKFTDKRIKVAFAMSPTGSYKQRTAAKNAAANQQAFSKVSIPWLLMTGTEDKSIISSKVTVDVRKSVYKDLPIGDKYQLVLKGAKHMAFSDRTLLGRNHRNANHHKAIQEISTRFFNAYLNGSKKDKAWLKSPAPMKILGKGDTWQSK